LRTSWHVATAAEAIAAAQFARLGFDVSVQYGANQPEYDLLIDNGEKTLKVSVKGSRDGGWGLTQSHLKNADYHTAVNTWRDRHQARTILCLVQFQGANLDDMPRVYVATPGEVAARLHDASGGRGDTILWENYTRGSKAAGAGTVEKIPDSWRLSETRAAELLAKT
jgi:hypothetical protein